MRVADGAGCLCGMTAFLSPPPPHVLALDFDCFKLKPDPRVSKGDVRKWCFVLPSCKLTQIAVAGLRWKVAIIRPTPEETPLRHKTCPPNC